MILIDHRAGSEELIAHPPFNICPKCGSQLRIERKKSKSKNPKSKSEGSIVSACCSSDPSHRLRAKLVNLASMCSTGNGNGNRNGGRNGTSTSADFQFTGRGPDGDLTIGGEIKSLSDLLNSINDGRLAATQLPHLVRHYDRSWLLYYGPYRANPDSGSLQVWGYDWTIKRYGWIDSTPRTTYVKLERFLTSPSLTECGIRIKHFPSLPDLAYWLGNVLYPIWQKEYSAHKALRTFDTSGGIPASHLLSIDPIRYQIMLTASSFPGLGFERAQAIASHFNSIEDMITASEQEWSEIKLKSRTSDRMIRLGPVLAKQIWTAIRKRRDQ